MTGMRIIVVLAAVMSVIVPAAGAEPAPNAGIISSRATPCAMAKASGKGEQCEVPALPATGSTGDLVAARIKRAKFYIDLNDKKGALTEADAALALDAADVDARHLAARLALSTGDISRAEREIKIAIAQRPDDPDLRATNAVRIKIGGRREDALREFDEILALRADYRFAREERAGLLMQLGKPDKAIDDLNLLLADRQEANLLAFRATAHLAMNEVEPSIGDFSAALKLAPGRFDLLTGRAAAYEIKGDDQAALADLDAILGPVGGPPVIVMREGDLAQYRMARSQVLIRLNRFADAATDMMTSISAGGRRSLLRAQVFLRQNGFPETPMDGQDSPALRAALQSCFGLNSCFQKISESL